MVFQKRLLLSGLSGIIALQSSLMHAMVAEKEPIYMQVLSGKVSDQELLNAACRGNDDTVACCLDEGASHTVRDTFWEKTPLTFAAQGGHVSIVQRLLAEKPDIGMCTEAFIGAVTYDKRSHNYVEVMQLLLKTGIDVESDTAQLLHGVIRNGNNTILCQLMEMPKLKQKLLYNNALRERMVKYVNYYHCPAVMKDVLLSGCSTEPVRGDKVYAPVLAEQQDGQGTTYVQPIEHQCPVDSAVSTEMVRGDEVLAAVLAGQGFADNRGAGPLLVHNNFGTTSESGIAAIREAHAKRIRLMYNAQRIPTDMIHFANNLSRTKLSR